MQLFDIDTNYQLNISPQAYTLIPFKNLWERDKSKEKDQAKKELAYVFFNNDYKSTFFNEPNEHTRKRIIIEHLFGKDSDWEPDEKVKEAEEFYQEYRDTFSLRLLKDAMYGLNSLREHFRNPGEDIKKYVETIEKIPKLIDALEKVEQRIKKEQETDNKLRGGREKGMYTD